MNKTIVLFAIAVTGLLPSCAHLGSSSGTRPGNVEHVVLVWLNEPGNVQVKGRIIETARTFPREIPGILSLSVGDAVPSPRDVVDDSFDLGLVVRFRDKAAMNAYEKHPVHVKAVKEVLAPNVSKLKVYDVMVR